MAGYTIQQGGALILRKFIVDQGGQGQAVRFVCLRQFGRRFIVHSGLFLTTLSAGLCWPPAPSSDIKLCIRARARDRRDMTVRTEEHTSELQSLMRISYAIFCLKKKIKI